MIDRVLLSGTDLVLVIDGRRHTVGRVVGRDGRAPNAPEIEAAAGKWLTQHQAELVGRAGKDVTPAMVAEAVAAWLSANPPKAGEDGADAPPPDPEVLALLAKQAAESWLEAHRESLRGKDGDDGDDGDDGVSPDPLPSIPGDTGPIGPMPKHQWDNTRVRFEMSPGVWGGWKELRGKAGRGGGGGGLTPEQITLITQAGNMNPLSGYRIADEDSADAVRYYGYTKPDGGWYLMRSDDTQEISTYRYCNVGPTDYAAAWTDRAALTYDYLHDLVIV